METTRNYFTLQCRNYIPRRESNKLGQATFAEAIKQKEGDN